MALMSWSLSGVDASRWRVQSASMWRLPVVTRRSSLVIPGRHGSLPNGRPPVFEEATAILEMLLRGETPSLEAAANELVGLLGAPGLVLGRTVDGAASSAPADLINVTPTDHHLAGAGTAARFSVQLTVPSVFLRAASADSTPTVVTNGATVPVAHLAAGTAPVTDAILRLVGPLDQIEVLDQVTGTGVSWTGTLDAGEYLFLNAASLTARVSSTATDWTSGGTNESTTLSYPGAGPLQIWPRMAGVDPAVRAANLTVNGVGFDATTALTVRAAPAYL
jgi:hypothetical protein